MAYSRTFNALAFIFMSSSIMEDDIFGLVVHGNIRQGCSHSKGVASFYQNLLIFGLPIIFSTSTVERRRESMRCGREVVCRKRRIEG